MRADGTAPHCPRCGRRHVTGLPCWGGRYVTRLRLLVLATYGDTCIHCGDTGARSIDHRHPRSHGGTDTLANLAPAHPACNTSRGTRPLPDPTPTETSENW